MKVAILHDYLNQFGGAERVLKAILEIFPDAHLYTLLYDEEKTLGLFRGNLKKTSFLDIPLVRRRHRAFIPLMPLAAESLKSKEFYDLIISSTAGYGKGLGIRGSYHISYCHTPLRYAWEIDYLKNLQFSPWPLKEVVVRPIAGWLRGWDKRTALNVNVFIANSQFIADKVKAYYAREAQVVYPPVDTSVFYPVRGRAPQGARSTALGRAASNGIYPDSKTNKPKAESYYLMVGRLLYYKGFDLGIKAFNRLKRQLKIIGRGPEFYKLKSIADPRYVEFIPFVRDEELRQIYSNAKALIFPQIEDFGLVAAEAQACGLPVLAFNRGGAKEIVEDGRTGLFFNEQTPEAIIESVERFDSLNFVRHDIAKRAERFSKERFKEEFKSIIKQSGLSI